MEGELLNLLAGIAARFGISWAGILGAAAGLVLFTNFLKATSPFNKWVFNSRIPYVIAGLSVVGGFLSYWGYWIQAIVAAILTTVVAVGGWSTAKMLAHKMAQPTATNPSGGAPKPTP